VCSDIAVYYRIEFDAVPVADRLLKMAEAYAGGFLEAATELSLTVAERPWPPTPFVLPEGASTCTLLTLVFRLLVLMDKASRVLAQGLPPAVPIHC
jgi:hypothetical protein